MASTNKTETLGLNQWIGSDKPKMEDFNSDNRLIDTALAGHRADQTVHVSTQERAAWNAAAPVIGSYTGDGQEERLITLGFQPRFGMVFAVDKNLVGMASQAGDMINYSACVAAQGGSAGAYIEETGFTVMQLIAATNRSVPNLNTKDVTYVYIMFR